MNLRRLECVTSIVLNTVVAALAVAAFIFWLCGILYEIGNVDCDSDCIGLAGVWY